MLAWVVGLETRIKAVLFLYGLFELGGLFSTYDPLKGLFRPFGHLGAVVIALLAMRTTDAILGDTSKYSIQKLRSWLPWLLAASVISFLVSWNLYYDLPEHWFDTEQKTRLRWQITLVGHLSFSFFFGVFVASANEEIRRRTR